MEKPVFAGPVRLLIHAGAGAITQSDRYFASVAEEAQVDMRRALAAGHAILSSGGSSLDAVTEAVSRLEDSPLFNAAKGSVFTREGKIEMDAAVMCGATRRAGAVALVHTIRNPVRAARAVLEDGQHVLLGGEGAERFAAGQGCAIVDPAYFFTADRHERWQRARRDSRVELDHHGSPDNKYGTVGAVAIDAQGRLSSATSTGGMTNKLDGRISDTPLPGVGTYADDILAVSMTGIGEYIMRTVAGHEMAALMRYQGATLAGAALEILRQIARLGGSGGLIAVDRAGHFTMPFNTSGMFRGAVTADGKITTAMFADQIAETQVLS